MKCLFYLHGGSQNHGCEAIVRSTQQILESNIGKTKIVVASRNVEMDKKYLGFKEDMELVSSGESFIKNSKINWFVRRVQERIVKRAFGVKKKYKNMLDKCDDETIAFSIGGDNYSESSAFEFTAVDTLVRTKCKKQVLWGCSMDPKRLDPVKNKDKIDSLKKFSLITARESITYNKLIELGFSNVKLYPDPAFTLEVDDTVNSPFESKQAVGINISPLVRKFEKGESSSLDNYVELVKYILEETEYDIALIPHVVYPKDNSDFEMALELVRQCPKTDRIKIIDDQDCTKLKAHISRCKYFICGRTHASIAAYSTCVPTLVVGYSVKARGIAKDIFGTDENYVLPVQNLKKRDDLKQKFIWLVKHEEEIQNQLNKVIPNIIKESWKAGKEIERLINEE